MPLPDGPIIIVLTVSNPLYYLNSDLTLIIFFYIPSLQCQFIIGFTLASYKSVSSA